MKRQLWADLNDIDESGCVVTTAGEAEPGVVLAPGAEVLAGNDDGELWHMRIEAVDADGWVRLAFLSTVEATALDEERAAG